MTTPGVNQPHDSARVFPSRYFPCFLLVLLSLAFSVGQAEVNPTNAQIAAALGSGKSGATLSNYGRKYSNSILRGVTLKDVYRFNDLLTTPYGPACAGTAVSQSENTQMAGFVHQVTGAPGVVQVGVDGRPGAEIVEERTMEVQGDVLICLAELGIGVVGDIDADGLGDGSGEVHVADDAGPMGIGDRGGEGFLFQGGVLSGLCLVQSP